MVKVIAQHVGFYGGRVHNIGDEFEVINEEWADEGTRPKWVELAQVPEEEEAQEDPGAEPQEEAAGVKSKAGKKKG